MSAAQRTQPAPGKGANTPIGGLGLGGAFLPPENAARLSVYRYVETALMRTLAGWIARAPELDVKIECGRQLAFAAERADALWKRVAQLLWPEERDVLLHPSIARLVREMDEAADTASLLSGLGQVVLPRLAEAYRQHASETDPITDAPTVRLLERLKPEVLSLAMWAIKRAAQITAEEPAAAARAAGHVRRLHGYWQAAGGWHTLPDGADGAGTGVSLQAELSRTPEGPGAQVTGLARDSRFRDLAPGEAPPPEPLQTPEGRLAYLLRTLNFELFAAELMGRNLYEYAHELPWQFTLDMARQCWDEARHAEIMIERIKATGVPWQPGEPGFTPYPLDNGPWHDIYPGGLFERLVAMNRGIEALALDTHVYRANTFEGFGDVVAGATHRYIVADEAPHVGFGTRWLRYLLFKESDPRQADLALVPFFPTMGQRFAPETTSLGEAQLAAYEAAEQEAWTNIAARRAARLAAEGREDFVAAAAGGGAAVPLGPTVLGVRRRDPVNVLARRLAGFTAEEIAAAIAAAGGTTVPEA
ncbi:MAG: DUF455 family protein [Chloroflexi bacterium]|nr:DUF455 family protein [Chloroflexota bacterium]